MNKLDLARRLAKQSHRSKAKAADDVDSLVYHLLKELKSPEESREKESSRATGAPRPRPSRES